MSEPRIRTRCPSCGHDTLFVPEHGLLTCSWIGCREPAAINDTVAELERLRASIKAQRETIGKLEDVSVQWMTEAKQSRAEIARLKADHESALAAAYTERNRLVAALARIYPSGTAKTAIEGWDPAWHGCVYIDAPRGQMSWHYHDSDAHLFESLPPYAGSWDGHMTDEKYARLASLDLPLALAAAVQAERERVTTAERVAAFMLYMETDEDKIADLLLARMKEAEAVSPSPEPVKCEQCEGDGYVCVQNPLTGELTRRKECPACCPPSAVEVAVQAEREAIKAHLDSDAMMPSEWAQRQPLDGWSWECGIVDAIAYINSRPSPAVDVMGVVREYIDARAKCDHCWPDTVKRYAAASDALRALVAPRTDKGEE
jgi:hypothetical protein